MASLSLLEPTGRRGRDYDPAQTCPPTERCHEPHQQIQLRGRADSRVCHAVVAKSTALPAQDAGLALKAIQTNQEEVETNSVS